MWLGCWLTAQEACPWLQLRPWLLKAHAIGSARDWVLGLKPGGEGGYDYVEGYGPACFYWWTGGNSAFQYFAANDCHPGNSTLDTCQHITAGKSVRVVVAWATRGTYTYDHRDDPHSIGTDFDVCVYKPSGAFLGCGSSWDNPYEISSFTAPETGIYRISIDRYDNRDAGARTDIGLSITMR